MKKLYRSKKDRKVCGVCAGIAEYFQLDPTLVRLAYILFMIFAGSGLLIYILCALIIPEQPDDYDDAVFDAEYEER